MQHAYHKTKTENAQGSCCSPILCNIYLDKLDQWMERFIAQETKGNYRRQNPDYAKARYRYRKALQNGSDPQTLKHLKIQRERLPSTDRYNPNFLRVNYVRYADDFLIGLIAPKAYALDLKQKIKGLLERELSLRLSDEKTKITHAADKDVTFLGYILCRGSGKLSKFPNNPFDPTLRVYMNTEGILEKLRENGMCVKNAYPIGITRLLQESPQEIVKFGNQVLRGLLTQQHGCSNFYEGWRIQYIVQYSIAKTLARKFDISLKKVFARYGGSLLVQYPNAKNKACSVRLALYTSFARQKDFFAKIKSALKDFRYRPEYDLKNPLVRACYICGNPHSRISMFHRKTKKKLLKPYSPIVTLMLAVNRRQLPLCHYCFAQAETGRFQLNQIKGR